MTDINKDALTGKPTTGHEWDGIQELNNPLPKWWLMVFYACILFSILWWVLYPAIPFLHGYTKGVLGYNSHQVYEQQATAAAQAQKVWLDKIAAASTDQISSDAELLNFAMGGGKALFNENCAACHAPGGAGRPGFPVLADDDWLWGGTLAAVEQTIRHGIRSSDPDTRNNVMPNFGTDGVLTGDQIGDVANYVLSLSGTKADADSVARGKQVFADNCVACHGEQAKGNQELGAPNLTDSVWLYGGDHKALIAQITKPHLGVMPNWQGRLTDTQIKMLAVYVHSLGGGQ
ncbi:MAG TPA: cytochrome-c oxidase, cbb3-type subunit III [Candidatus Binatia bacterium]|nr:cytochrome-c oxidase, cbb3-type subunit III [Candidatus Binatia bacterium]